MGEKPYFEPSLPRNVGCQMHHNIIPAESRGQCYTLTRLLYLR